MRETPEHRAAATTLTTTTRAAAAAAAAAACRSAAGSCAWATRWRRASARASASCGGWPMTLPLPLPLTLTPTPLVTLTPTSARTGTPTQILTLTLTRWPGTITQLWSNGDVDVRYDDGDFEAQKPRSRVRPLRGAGAGAPDAPKLKHARHSHVAFLVGRPAGWGAPGGGLGRSGLRLAMLEEGLFASADGALTKPHAQVH